MKKFNTIIQVLSIIAGIVLFTIDWKIALCVFFTLWGNNITHKQNDH